MTDYDPRFVEGVRFFNACDFFEAHEVWEELWGDDQSSSRRFVQGLIQLAVCLHHFGNGNLRGARKLFHSSTKYLSEFRPVHSGIDVDALLADFERCCADLLAAPDEISEDIVLVPDLIPEIQLDPPAAEERP